MKSEQPGPLFISSLPSLTELKKIRKLRGVKTLLNVAGVDIREIYQAQDLTGFEIAQFEFADVFSKGNPASGLSKGEADYVELYESVSEPSHRHGFSQAVKTLKASLEEGKPTLIFCHRGLSRSPLVAAAALNLIYEEPIEKSLNRVRKIHPPSEFTDLGISAILWCKSQPLHSA